MKRVLVAAVLLLAVSAPLLAAEATVPPPTADQQQDQGPRYTIFTKFFRGVGNIIMAPIEIPVSVFNVAAETDVFIGITAGTVAGAAAGVERLGCGVLDVATFLFPPYDRPLITHELGKSAAAKATTRTFPREL